MLKILRPIYLTRKQVNPDFSGLKDATILKGLSNDITNYESLLTKGLGTDLSRFTAENLVNYIQTQKETAGGNSIDFIAFCNTHIQKLKDNEREGTAGRFGAVVRNICDYFGRSVVYVKEINVANLLGFIEYMQNRAPLPG